MNSFEQICITASENRWCWKINCTTCGHHEFTQYFQELCNSDNPYKLKLEIEGVLETFTGTDLDQLNLKCKFPDWLGYLGLVLHDFYGSHNSIRELHQNWSSKLMGLVPSNSYVFNELKDVSGGYRRMTLASLERCESAIIEERFKQLRM